MAIFLFFIIVYGNAIGCNILFADSDVPIKDIIFATVCSNKEFLSKHCDLAKSQKLRIIILIIMLIIATIVELVERGI